MASPDLLIGATSVKTIGTVASWDGVYQGSPFRGTDLVVPGRRGQVFAAAEFDAYTFPVPMILLGSSQADFQDKLRTLSSLRSVGSALTVSRVVASGSGDLTQTCSARCRVGDVGMVNGLITGKVGLEITNLDGCWYGPAATPTIPATITVDGTARTNRITLVLPGAGTLTNTSLGVALTVTAGMTVAVQTKDTTGSYSAISASGDPFGNWFTLAPGSNVITWSGSGTPTISYNPAFA